MSSVISAEQAKLIACRACDTDNLEVIYHQLEPYSKSKIGFLGSHQKLAIGVRREGSSATETLNFFVKSLPRESEAQLEFVKQRRVFSQEAEFFVKLMPRLIDATTSAAAAGDVEAWAPECYLADEALIVLEDVRNRGFVMRRSKILTSDELKSAVRAMARMHAASTIAEKKLGRALDELYPQACREQIFHSQIRLHGAPLLEALIVDVAERRENRRCRNVGTMINRAFDFVTRRRDDAKNNRVICHGDAWPNNVMLNDDAKPAKCLLVDYQMTRYASRMLDVAQLLCLSTYRDDREREEKAVVRVYWQEFCETLSKCEPSIDGPLYDELIDEYDEAKQSALFIAVLCLPIIMLGDDVFAEHQEDPATLYRKFVFRRDNECVLELMDRDEEYARRITEAVLAFVENGEKIAAAKE